MRLGFRSKLLKDNSHRPSPQREALLHLVHTDTFQAIVSTDHKEKISKTFADLVTLPTDDVDRQLEQIRPASRPSTGQATVSSTSLKSKTSGVEGHHRRPPVTTSGTSSLDAPRRMSTPDDWKARRLNTSAKWVETSWARVNAVLASASHWNDLLKHALRTRVGHPIAWTLLSDFNTWCGEHLEEALGALQALWAEDDLSDAERIRAFTNILPDSALRGAVGNSTNVISVLLMGLDVEQYPPFRVTLFDRAYGSTGYGQPERGADEAALYEHALGFLDRFIEEAAEAWADLAPPPRRPVGGLGDARGRRGWGKRQRQRPSISLSRPVGRSPT